MSASSNFIDSVNQVIQTGVQHGILHLYTDNEPLSDIGFNMQGKAFENFGSCSYLGLEFHPEMKKAAIQAIEQYGTQFSSSRAYVSIHLYRELEELFTRLFEKPVVMAQTTSLAHIATLPVIIQEGDAVILDHQVHNSVQTAAQLLKAKNIPVEMLRHNRMDLLENRIVELRRKHKHVWYLADGIYSMYGDKAPLTELKVLMEKFPEFHLYLDDAHGMSCYGKNGRGYVLEHMHSEPKVITVVSLAKGFATGGSVIVCPDKKTASLIRTCGGPLITSGPSQPGTLGAALAAAKIHLSGELLVLQEQLSENIKFANLMIEKYRLPLVHKSDSPVFYIAAGAPKFAYALLQRMMNEGFYLNLGAFPAVPMKNAGVRFTVTARHSFESIHRMIELLCFHYKEVLLEQNVSLEETCKAFKIAVPDLQPKELISEKTSLQIAHYNSCAHFSSSDWDGMMMDRGIFDYKGLQFLESVFASGKDEKNKWDFDYLIIRDPKRKIVFATFFTTAWMKDDMLASAKISENLETERKLFQNEMHRCSRILMTGSLLSEGEHFYLDTDSEFANEAVIRFHEFSASLMQKRKADGILIRDFESCAPELENSMNENGFFPLPMPEAYSVSLDSYSGIENYISGLSPNSRKNVRKEILRYEDLFQLSKIETPDENTLRHFYQLYLNVKSKSLELNTFTLPFSMFLKMAEHPNWEFLTLHPKVKNALASKAVAVVLVYKSATVYHPMIIGLDYSVPRAISPYRQILFRLIQFAGKCGYKKIRLGFSAGVEKKKVGSSANPVRAYMQANDNFMFESLHYNTGEEISVG